MEFELISCIMGHFMLNIDFQNCICYNADRLRDIKSPLWAQAKTPEMRPPGFSMPFYYGGLDHRLVAYFLSLSSHLQMRWLITPAATAIIRDIKTSIASTPFLSPDLGRQRIDYTIIATHILLFSALKIVYRATTSYTALYRLLAFRHMLISKNAYRWSGTFRQITLMIFGDFVY